MSNKWIIKLFVFDKKKKGLIPLGFYDKYPHKQQHIYVDDSIDVVKEIIQTRLGVSKKFISLWYLQKKSNIGNGNGKFDFTLLKYLGCKNSRHTNYNFSRALNCMNAMEIDNESDFKSAPEALSFEKRTLLCRFENYQFQPIIILNLLTIIESADQDSIPIQMIQQFWPKVSSS